jgi:hypothetical protein
MGQAIQFRALSRITERAAQEIESKEKKAQEIIKAKAMLTQAEEAEAIALEVIEMDKEGAIPELKA